MQNQRPQSLTEEIVNSLTHGVGALLSLIMLPVLIIAAARGGDPWRIVAAAVYGATLVLLYTTSTLYHALPGRRAKAILRRCDHAAIYLLIAGTYTPFVLGPMRGAWGYSVFGVIWTLAAAGVVFKAAVGIRLPHLSTTLYVAMGWLIVIALVPLTRSLPVPALVWLLAGGVLYTGGVVFYVSDHRMRFGHAIWHLFVLAGSASHCWAVLGYAVQRGTS
jgi:hemolysin III